MLLIFTLLILTFKSVKCDFEYEDDSVQGISNPDPSRDMTNTNINEDKKGCLLCNKSNVNPCPEGKVLINGRCRPISQSNVL